MCRCAEEIRSDIERLVASIKTPHSLICDSLADDMKIGLLIWLSHHSLYLKYTIMYISHRCIHVHTATTVKLSPHWSPISPQFVSHSPRFIMRLNKQIKTTCGMLTISNHSNSVYLYIKLLAFQILSILVCEAIIITALATFTLKVKIKGITISGEQIFSMFLCNLNVRHCNMIFTVQSMSQMRTSATHLIF